VRESERVCVCVRARETERKVKSDHGDSVQVWRRPLALRSGFRVQGSRFKVGGVGVRV